MIRSHPSSSSAAASSVTTASISQLPQKYTDCTTPEEKIAWLDSPNGQKMLQKRPKLQQLHWEGKLKYMVAHPQYASKMNGWLSDISWTNVMSKSISAMFSSYGNNNYSNSNASAFASVAALMPPVKPFSTEVKLCLLTDGFAIVKNFIPLALCHDAIRCVNRVIGKLVCSDNSVAIGSGNERGATSIDLTGEPRQLKGGLIDTTSLISMEPALLALYNNSSLVGAVSLLLHGDCGADEDSHVSGSGSGGVNDSSIVYASSCQIALRFPDCNNRNNISDAAWHTDGVDKLDYSPFSVLIGVVLSDQPEDNMGNLCVYPGSHYTLQSSVRRYADAVSHAYLNAQKQCQYQCQSANIGSTSNSNDASTIVSGYSSNSAYATSGVNSRLRSKVSVTSGQGVSVEAQQASHEFLSQTLPGALPLRAGVGDVIILHQKLAHRGTSNHHYDIRRMIYFRVSHRHHDQLKDSAIENLWLEFEGMSDVL